MGTVSIAGTTFMIYGTHQADDAGPPVVLSAVNYFKASLAAGNSFSSAAFGVQQQALVVSTRMIDRARYEGTRTSAAQPLEFPRDGLTDKDGNALASGTTPVDVVHASYELANALIADTDNSIQTSPGQGSNVRRTLLRKRVEGAVERETETEYFRPTLFTLGRFPQIVQELLAPFLTGGASLLTPFASGTDLSSSFLSVDFGFSGEGLP